MTPWIVPSACVSGETFGISGRQVPRPPAPSVACAAVEARPRLGEIDCRSTWTSQTTDHMMVKTRHAQDHGSTACWKVTCDPRLIANHIELNLNVRLYLQDFELVWLVGCLVHRTLPAGWADVGDASAGILTGRPQVLWKTSQPNVEI